MVTKLFCNYLPCLSVRLSIMLQEYNLFWAAFKIFFWLLNICSIYNSYFFFKFFLSITDLTFSSVPIDYNLGLPNKGHAIKGFVVCNGTELESLDLLNSLALGCYQPSNEAWFHSTTFSIIPTILSIYLKIHHLFQMFIFICLILFVVRFLIYLLKYSIAIEIFGVDKPSKRTPGVVLGYFSNC